jgi:hypothetical protein
MKTLILIGLLFISYAVNAQKVIYSHVVAPSDCRQENGFISFLTDGIHESQSGIVTFKWNNQTISRKIIVGAGGLSIGQLRVGQYQDFVFSYIDKVSRKNIRLTVDSKISIPPYQDFWVKITDVIDPTCSTSGSIAFEVGFGKDGEHTIRYMYNNQETVSNVVVVDGKFTVTNLGIGSYSNFSLRRGLCETHMDDKVLLTEKITSVNKCVHLSVKVLKK